MKPSILLTAPDLQFFAPRLEQRFTVIRAWDARAAGGASGVRAIVCLGSQSMEPYLERFPDVEFIACFTAGYDGIDVPAMARRGIPVSHARSAPSYAVAEYALALMLAAFRNVVVGNDQVRNGGWIPGHPLIGRSLAGHRLGIVGLGDIGQHLGKLAAALKMDVGWWGPRPKPDARWPRAASLLDLAKGSDILVVCARSDASNRHLIDAGVIAAVGPEGLIINVGRGQLIDEDALIAALRDRRLGAAALDVFQTEPTPRERWADVPGLIATPHIAGATTQSVTTMGDLVLENLTAFFAGAPIVTPIIPGPAPPSG